MTLGKLYNIYVETNTLTKSLISKPARAPFQVPTIGSSGSEYVKH